MANPSSIMAAAVKSYRYRWLVLVSFMALNLAMQITWICFAPVMQVAAQYYGVTDLQIGFLAMVYMIVYIQLALPASWVIDVYGFRKGVGVGAVLLGVFGLLRGIYVSDYQLTLLFTIGIAAGQPFLRNAFTKLAANWFPLHERATAVALATVSAFLGIAIGQILTPYLVLASGFGHMQLVYGVVAALSAIVLLIVAREEPPTPASPDSFRTRVMVLDGLKTILRRRELYYLVFTLFESGGIFNGISTFVESIMRPRVVSLTDAGLFGGVMLIGEMVGALHFSRLSDRLQKRKVLIVPGHHSRRGKITGSDGERE